MTVNIQNNSDLNKITVYFSVMYVKEVFQLAGIGSGRATPLSGKLNTRCLFIRHQLELSHMTMPNSRDLVNAVFFPNWP